MNIYIYKYFLDIFLSAYFDLKLKSGDGAPQSQRYIYSNRLKHSRSYWVRICYCVTYSVRHLFLRFWVAVFSRSFRVKILPLSSRFEWDTAPRNLESLHFSEWNEKKNEIESSLKIPQSENALKERRGTYIRSYRVNSSIWIVEGISSLTIEELLYHH